MFCKNCGKIMKIEKENDRIIGRCSCGFNSEINVSSEENIKKPVEKGKGYVNDKNLLATFPHKCKKCNHDLAEVIELGVWFGDEAGVIRYKCGKCGYTEQDKDSNT